jgi:alanine racemase
MRSTAEISTGSLRANLCRLRKQTRSRVIAVVKADAYGHDISRVVPVLEKEIPDQPDYLAPDAYAVADVGEALSVLPMCRDKPVFLFGSVLEREIDLLQDPRLVITVSSREEVSRLAALVRPYPVLLNLKVDTGMGREGILPEEVSGILSRILAAPGLQLFALGTHLPCADEDDDFTRNQLAEFNRLCRTWRTKLPGVWFHALNSAGSERFPEYSLDAVRPGLALYGISSLANSGLSPVLSWKTSLAVVKNLPPGHGVSYGRTFITDRPLRIGLLPLGYADGYPRSLSNKGEVLIRGARCRVLGRVTMDQIVVDLSPVPGSLAGEEVVLIGVQNHAEISCSEMAREAGTIPWEILTGIGRRVVRVSV